MIRQVRTSAIECRKVSFSYDKQVLFDVALAAFPGEVLAIIGPNGSGKTTLLKILYGALRPDVGEVLLDGGQKLAALNRRQIARAIATVGQEPAVNFPITVFEFVMQGRYPHLSGLGFEGERDVMIVSEALRQAHLMPLARRRVAEISGGERQRMLLARALAQQPKILLLDEPTTNLDIRFQVELFTLIRRLTRDLAMATVMVTHDINLVCEFADRVALFHQGRVFSYGMPQEVLTEENIRSVFGVPVLVDTNPATGKPRISLVCNR